MYKDTSVEIEKIYIKKLKEKTDIERALMGFSMFETARYLVKTNLSSSEMTERNIKIVIFNRFYGNDFTGETKERILKRLIKKP